MYALRSSMKLNDEAWYYAGYFIRHQDENDYVHCIPGNAAQKKKILKIASMIEAMDLAKTLNSIQNYYTYNIEEI